MLLGDVISKFEDEAFVSETLFGLDDLALTAQVVAVAAEDNVSTGEFVRQSVGQFVNGATDEEWLTLIGLMSRTDNPGQIFLRRVLSNALPNSQGCDCG